jgi:methyl-accepting chemotaxis protein/methyl-accepting chemotaxis protein-1 (serine sensor receptor)
VTISKKLGLGVGILLLLVTALGVTSWKSLGLVSGELNVTLNRTTVMLDLVQGIAKRSLETESDCRGAALAYATGDLPAAEQDRKRWAAAFVRLGEMIHDLTPLLDSSGDAHLQVIQRNLDQIRPLEVTYMDLGKDHKAQEASQLMKMELLPRLTSVETEALAAVRTSRATLADSAKHAATIEAMSHFAVAGVFFLALLSAFGVAWTIRDIARMLTRIVNELSDGADQIFSAAQQVSVTSKTLARGASEQAASIEETAASTEQISATSRKNSDNARSMVALAVHSEVGFRKTDSELDTMVHSMNELNQASGKIAKIIGEIDAIAFQTNILALNAAVEAARAGQAGMGFGVVAEEVRNLAQRSAKAADDTGRLIEHSIEKTSSGKAKVDLVATTIREITSDSARIKTFADEVSLGSDEQTKGLDQIARAIHQMEQVTQSAAANAEQSAAMSQELTTQSENLREIVFLLNKMVGGGGSAAEVNLAAF